MQLWFSWPFFVLLKYSEYIQEGVQEWNKYNNDQIDKE
jgi:hypothetical protein